MAEARADEKRGSLPDVPADNHAGTLVAGRFRVERQIGHGGMGTVWAGRHVSLNKLVAVKFIHDKLASSQEALRRFDTEAKAAARLKSRHAVEVFDHGVTSSGQPYIVMEHLEGETLEAAIRRRGRLPIAEVTRIIQQAASALAAAHEQGIVHRDLKPENIFLAREREAGDYGYIVKLVDFGIAKIVHDEAASGAAATQAGAVLGTPHYMSPEALTSSAPVSAASDVWSLGVCAFAALTGRPPFEGDAIGDVVLQVCAAPLPVPTKISPSLPRAFDAWFAKSCKRNPQERFGSILEQAQALADLDRWAGIQSQASAYALQPAQEVDLDLPDPGAGRGKTLALVLVIAALAIGGAGYYAAKIAREANRNIEQTARSAASVVDGENERKLREAEKQFWQSVESGQPAPSAAPKLKE